MEQCSVWQTQESMHENVMKLPGFCSQESGAGFDRYWNHYEAMKEWVQTCSMICSERDQENIQRRTNQTRTRNRSVQHCKGKGLKHRNDHYHHQESNMAPESYQRDADDSDSDSRSVEFEMEVSEELRDFFILSQKHREEREKQRQDEEKSGDEDAKIKEKKTTEAPQERPGTRRNEEMKLLYGKNAPMIQGLETAIQMEFDHVLDRKQPEMWPSIALNL